MKCLLKLLVISILCLALLIGAGVAMIEPMLSSAIREGVGYTTQQETQLESVDFKLFSGEFGFEGLSIANPPGFQETPLLTVQSFKTQLDTSSLGADTIDMNSIELNGLELALELKGTKSNVNDLLSRLRDLQQQFAGTDEANPAQPSDPAAEGPGLNIRRIRIAGIKASLRISDVPLADGVYQVELPDMQLDEFPSQLAGAKAPQWTAHVLEQLLTRALSEGEGIFPGQWQQLLQSGLGAQDLLDGALKKAQDKLGTEGKQLLEKAKNDPASLLKDHKQKLKKLGGLLDKHK